MTMFTVLKALAIENQTILAFFVWFHIIFKSKFYISSFYAWELIHTTTSIFWLFCCHYFGAAQNWGVHMVAAFLTTKIAVVATVWTRLKLAIVEAGNHNYTTKNLYISNT